MKVKILTGSHAGSVGHLSAPANDAEGRVWIVFINDAGHWSDVLADSVDYICTI